MSMMDLASALRGDPAGGGPAGEPGENPAEEKAEGPQGELFEDSMQALDVAEEALHAFIRMDPDAQDKATAARALQVVLGLKGSHSKSVQAGDAKSLSRALSGSSSIGRPGPGPGGPGLGGPGGPLGG
jgi:hypothetical protein